MTTTDLPTRFARNAGSNYLLAVVMAVVALVTTPILTGHLGPQKYGIWIFVGSTIAYVELLDLGIGGAVVSFVARLSAAGDEDGLDRTISTSFFVLVGLGLGAFVVTVVASQFVPDAIHLSPALRGTTRTLLIVLGFDMAVSLPMDIFGCGLVALQRFELLNLSMVGVVLAQAVAWTVVLLTGGSLLELGFVTVAISLVGQVVRWRLLRRAHPALVVSPKLVDRSVFRSLRGPAGWFALASSIAGFRDYANVLVLSVVRNVATAGAFAVGEKLALLGTKLGTPVTDPYFPHAAAMVGSGDRAGLGKTARTGTRIATGVTIPCCLVVGVLARPALSAWVGPSFVRAAPVVTILAVAFAIGSLGAAPFKIVSGSGDQKLLSVLGMVEAAVNIALTAVLGFSLGLTGVALAMLATVTGIELCVTLPLVCRRLGIGVAQLLGSTLRAHGPPVVAAGGLGWYLSRGPLGHFVARHGRIEDVAVVAGAGVVVMALYLVVFSGTGLDGTERRAVLARVPGARRHVPPGAPAGHDAVVSDGPVRAPSHSGSEP
jgi:O-antigen/teichoic acid export membrane protein